MARLGYADFNALPEEFSGPLKVIEESNGYIPNSYRILAHKPLILQAFMALSKAVIRDEGDLDRGFRFLVAYISSSTAGCQFCQVHNIQSAAKWGVSDEKLNAIWEYEESDLFTEGEKAAFDMARGASVTPNAVDDEVFDRLRANWSETQIVEMVSVVSLFGWLNRFNDTLNTALEDGTMDWAADFGLADKTGWNPENNMPDPELQS